MKNDVIKLNCRACGVIIVYEIGSLTPPTCPHCKKSLIPDGQTIVKTDGKATCLKCGEVFTPPENIHPTSLSCPVNCKG